MPRGNLRVHWGMRHLVTTLCGMSPRYRRLATERADVDCPTCVGLMLGSLGWRACDACGRDAVVQTDPSATRRACTCGRGHHTEAGPFEPTAAELATNARALGVARSTSRGVRHG